MLAGCRDPETRAPDRVKVSGDQNMNTVRLHYSGILARHSGGPSVNDSPADLCSASWGFSSAGPAGINFGSRISGNIDFRFNREDAVSLSVFPSHVTLRFQ